MCLRRNTKCAHFRGSDILHETRKQMGDIISYSLFGLHFGGLKPLANMNFSENLHWLLDTFKLLYVHDDYISQACSGVPYSLRIFSGFFTQSVKIRYEENAGVPNCRNGVNISIPLSGPHL